MNQIYTAFILFFCCSFASAMAFGHPSDSLSPVNETSYFIAHDIKSMQVISNTYGTPSVHEVWIFDTQGRAIYQKPYRNLDACEIKYDKRDRKKSLKLFTIIQDSVMWNSTENFTYHGKTNQLKKTSVRYPDGFKKTTKTPAQKFNKKSTKRDGDTTVIYDYFLINKVDTPLPKYKIYQLNDTTTLANEYFYDTKGKSEGVETTYTLHFSSGHIAESGYYEYDYEAVHELLETDKQLYWKLYRKDKLYKIYPYPGLEKFKTIEHEYKFTTFGRILEYISEYEHVFFKYNSDHQILEQTYRYFGDDYKKIYEYNNSGLLLGFKTYKEDQIITNIQYQYEFYKNK